MNKLLSIGLTGALLTGCANVGFLEGSNFGAMIKSNNPDEYSSTFKAPSVKAGNPGESIYGFNVGQKVSNMGRLDLLGEYRGSKIYEVKKIGKGVISDRIKSMHLAVEPTSNVVESINVVYGKGGQVDGDWLKSKLKPILIGSNRSDFSNAPNERGYTYWKNLNLAQCYKKQIKSRLAACDARTSGGVVYRDEGGVIYMLDYSGSRLSIFGRLGIKNAVDAYATQGRGIKRWSKTKPTVKTGADDNGYRIIFEEYTHLKDLPFYFGADLHAKLERAKVVSKKEKSRLDQFTLRLSGTKDYGMSDQNYDTLSVHPRYRNTYWDARKFYSAAIPAILNRDLGCKFSKQLLPAKHDNSKRFNDTQTCTKGKISYTLRVAESANAGSGSIGAVSPYLLTVKLDVRLK